MKLRMAKGANITVSFGEVDCSKFAPLHRRLGIQTYVHRQAVLLDLVPGGRGSKSTDDWSYDPVNRVWSSNHLYRASVTLPRV